MSKERPLLNLLDESFPGIKANILRCEKLGFPWNSKPFLKEENRELISSVGFLEYPIEIDRQPHKAAALHAICTKINYRNRGLASQLNGMISYEIKNKALHLYDIISQEFPSLDLILDHLPSAIDDIYFYFSPDRFTNAAVPEPYLYDHGHFLVGNWPSTKPFMIPPLNRC